MKKGLPIGIDNFRKLREKSLYFVDKSLFIKEFLERDDEVTLVTRPRRFGKTLCMTMTREFFDITKDSKAIFDGLAIMDTEYADRINSRPVIYFAFKDCTGESAETLRLRMNKILLAEYDRHLSPLGPDIREQSVYMRVAYENYEMLSRKEASFGLMAAYPEELVHAVHEAYGETPLLLIDEYDSPIMSAYENGYRDELREFFTGFYGMALKGNDHLWRAILTGIQRVAKESIFSKLNNLRVYTVLDKAYARRFGLTTEETDALLRDFSHSLDEGVKAMYDGYLFGGEEIYNPWSVLNYADTGELEGYWVNTSSNVLVREAITGAGADFRHDYEKLLEQGSVAVPAALQTAFAELQNAGTLWGLLTNAGYLTVTGVDREFSEYTVRIPNGEVRREFMAIVESQTHMGEGRLHSMFARLLKKDIEGFTEIYRNLVLSCTSYFDAKENAYHMLFLGMCLSLQNLYRITSNAESGDGRSDIRMESLSPDRPHFVIEFKQGEDTAALKEEALRQIRDRRYRAGLSGEVVCLGVAHNKKRCEIAYESLRT